MPYAYIDHIALLAHGCPLLELIQHFVSLQECTDYVLRTRADLWSPVWLALIL
jgi:hypothetical protein